MAKSTKTSKPGFWARLGAGWHKLVANTVFGGQVFWRFTYLGSQALAAVLLLSKCAKEQQMSPTVGLIWIAGVALAVGVGTQILGLLKAEAAKQAE